MFDPFFFFRRTEWPDRTARPNGPTERAQTKNCLMEFDITVDGGGHILRTTRCCCAVACAKGYRSYLFGWRGPTFWMDSDSIFYLGTARTAMSSLVPFLPVPQGRIGLRHALRSYPIISPEHPLKLVLHALFVAYLCMNITAAVARQQQQ